MDSSTESFGGHPEREPPRQPGDGGNGTERRFALPAELASNPAWIAGIVHDLRQPLAMLAARQLDPEGKYAFKELSQLIDELADAATSQGGERGVVGSTFDVDEVMETARVAARPTTTQASVRIEVHRSGLWLHAPRSRVYRIYANLTSNAVRHSHGDLVDLGAERIRNGVRLIVRDNGRGITKDKLHRIDQAARHWPGSVAALPMERLGHGHGLRTAMQLAESMGGQLFAAWSNKTGTEWHCELPLDLLGMPREGLPGGDAPLAGRLIVVLDDIYPIARATADRFKALGAEVMVFTDEFDMLTVTDRLPHPPDLYVIDYMLRDDVAIRTVHELAERPEPLRAVILTAHPNNLGLRELQPALPIIQKPLGDDDFFDMCRLAMSDPLPPTPGGVGEVASGPPADSTPPG